MKYESKYKIFLNQMYFIILSTEYYVFYSGFILLNVAWISIDMQKGTYKFIIGQAMVLLHYLGKIGWWVLGNDTWTLIGHWDPIYLMGTAW